MGKLFGINMPKVIHGAMRGKLGRVTLIKVTQGVQTAGALAGPANATETNYRGEGFFDDWPGNFPANQSLKKDSVVQRGDRMIAVFGASLRRGIIPAVGDKIVLDAKTFRVVAVGVDPAASTGLSVIYKCQVRGS